MQSADPGALRVLQRVHTPGAAVAAALSARGAGFDHVSLDLIYGVPGQSADSWRSTVLSALDADPDHVSAYALGVEPGTALARQVSRGEVAAPDPDLAAAAYDIADALAGRTRCRLVRDLQLGEAGWPLRAQPRLLARGQLVGLRPGRAFARRRRAVVERQTPGHLPGDAGRGRQSGGSPGGARRPRAAVGGGHASGPSAPKDSVLRTSRPMRSPDCGRRNWWRTPTAPACA